MTVVLLAGIGMLLIYSLSSFVGVVANVGVRMRGFIHYQTALHSLLDYTVNGVRQKWCFTPAWLENPTCTLFDANNVERLLLSEESLTAIEVSGTPHPVPLSATRTKKIDVTTPISAITSSHVLFKIIQQLANLGVEGIRFEIERVDNYNTPTKSREIVLQSKVTLILEDVDPSRYPFVEAQMVVFPRELATNALVIANDFNLDAPTANLPSTPGDAAVRPEGGFNAGIKGLRFESPVFVNGDIRLPANANSAFAHVSFVDKVILGGGHVYSATALATPLTAGGAADRFYTQSRQFGGFLGGIEMDPGRDSGLDYFAGIVPASPLDLSNLNLCKKRVHARSDLSLTKASQLFNRYDGSSVSGMTSQYNMELHTGSLDGFKEQTIVPVATSFGSSVLPAPTLNNNGKKPILRVHVGITGYTGSSAPLYARGDLSADSTFTIQMGAPSGGTVPAIVISTTPFTYPGGMEQTNQVDFQVRFENQDLFNVGTVTVAPGMTSPASIHIEVEAYDYAYGQGVNNRVDPETIHDIMKEWKNNGFTFLRGADQKYQIMAGGPVTVGAWQTCSLLNAVKCSGVGYPVFDPSQAPIDMDYAEFDKKCNMPPSDPNQYYPSFQASDWGVSFAPTARFSWGFTEAGTATQPGFYDGVMNFTAGGGSAFDPGAGVYPTFKIHSIVKTCVVTSSANFLAGFLTCDEFIIEPRATPLRIIGTVITGRMVIDPTAIAAGIRWSSIYSPTAVYELREARILKAPDGIDCESPSTPAWHPYPAISFARAMYSCNALSLGALADPFRWTMVDPDCGILSGQAAVTCKSRVMRFAIRELWRRTL
ncbi:MAG: hypothetical protein NDI61_03625 [Bdellovibrionaceae bacterium]|nr:hypothetical protein [Pseudobdellovibrionaceae bacterium]